MWAVAGALLAFAPVASALSYDLTLSNERVYATESITSRDVVIGYQGDAPQAELRINMLDSEYQGIGRNDTIEVTFTLVNALLGRNITASALEPAFVNSNITGCTPRVRSAVGDRGSASATFSIEAAAADCAGSGGSGVILTFTMPSLMGLDATLSSTGAPTKPVYVRVTTDTPGGSGWLGLSTENRGLLDVCGADGGADSTPDGDDGSDCAQVTTNNVLSARAEGTGYPEKWLIGYRNGLSFTGRSSGNSVIDLAGGRTALYQWVGRLRPQAYLGSVSVGIANADDCTQRTAPYGATTSACTLQANGRPFSLGRGGDGRGDLHVTVTGDFRSSDVVFLDLDGNHEPGSGESLDLQSNGSMQESFSLDRVAGNARATEGDAGELDRDEGVATKNLIYRPNGRDPLRPGEYRSSYSVTTASASVANKPAQPSSGAHSTTYTLVEGAAKNAYAIPPMRAGDSGMVRVKCEVATHCMVYLECDDQDGMSHFAQVGDPVPGRSTLVLTAEDLSSELGLMEGDWESGRMSCSIYSTREISVQQLTRSSTGVLVNNTYVAD